MLSVSLLLILKKNRKYNGLVDMALVEEALDDAMSAAMIQHCPLIRRSRSLIQG